MLQQGNITQKQKKQGQSRRKACIICQARSTASELPYYHPQNINDATKVLESLEFSVDIVELSSSKHLALHLIRNLTQKVDVFLNLYRQDDEIAQTIINYFLKNGIPFIGSSISYPSITEIKKLCLFYDIPTSTYQLVDNENDLKKCKEIFNFPLLVKTDLNLKLQGLSPNFIVENEKELNQKVQYIWKNFGGALVEPFIGGDEFIVFVTGWKRKCMTYPAIQIFVEKTISFENQRDGDSKNGWMPVQDSQLNHRLQKIAKNLFFAAQTQSYATIRIIRDQKTDQLLVIDYNSSPTIFLQDGLSHVENILKISGNEKQELMQFLLDHAFERSKRYNTHKYQVVRTKQHGIHIIAKEDIKKGQFIYTDQMQPIRIVTDEYYKKNWIEEDQKDFQQNAWPIGHRVFGIWSSNPSDWKPLNHSCDPSIYVDLLSYYARRDIKKGEALTINISTFEERHPQFECWCKTKYCKGKLFSEEYKNKQFQERFKGQLGSYIEGLVLGLNEKNK